MISFQVAERSIFEALRLAVVAAGYLPNITASGNATAWKAARTALADTLKALDPSQTVVDVFGVGAPESRNEELISRIVIDREGSVSGSIGGAPATKFKLTSGVEGEAGAKYTKQFLPAMSEDVTYEILTATNTIFMDRVIRVAIKKALKGRHYVPTVDADGNPDGDYILVEFISEVDKTAEDNLLRSFRYIVYDLYDEVAEDVETDIASMDTITYQISVLGQDVDLSELNEKGQWNANTNIPALSDETGTKSDYYGVSVAGTQNLGSGNITWVKNDVIFHDGIKWIKLNS